MHVRARMTDSMLHEPICMLLRVLNTEQLCGHVVQVLFTFESNR